MKCIDKIRKRAGLLCLLGAAALFMTGCGQSTLLADSYNPYKGSYVSGSMNNEFFASNLCKTSDINFGTGDVTASLAEAAGVFNLDTQQVTYCQNIFQRMYPASTTKILTAYIIIRNCNLDDKVTISYNASHPDPDSSICGLKENDILTVRDLLYGLLLASGNDAAIALAEYYAGSEEAFVDIMNQEAARIGATGTHFSNSCGLPDENHYTTVYDMYLMFQEAVLMQDFVQIASTDRYAAEYLNEKGVMVTNKWENTCRYVSGYVSDPEDIDVIAGKTGTTNSAGYCLCLYSLNSKNERVISIVFKSKVRADLYKYMNEILRGFAN